ncbi:glycosyltransferase [Thalassospira sp. CH_XMU1448-2]|jgi:glycosyltransferase involved in cell wall biosynthesis|uniref:glycosyltransferase n=1 Tax=Thalassospira sp. CH_XMU1448-2 TaxID=3107773 RepID=UPI00300AD42F
MKWLIESAIKRARKVGVSSPGLLLGSVVAAEEIEKLISDARINALIVRSKQLGVGGNSHQDRVGSWDGQRDYVLPRQLEDLFYIGSAGRIRKNQLAGAWHAGVKRFYICIVGIWVCIPVEKLYSLANIARKTERKLAFTVDSLRLPLAYVVEKIYAIDRALGLRFLNHSTRVPIFISQKDAFRVLLEDAQGAQQFPRSVPKVVLVCGSLGPGGAERQVANTTIGLKNTKLVDATLLVHELQSGPHKLDFHLPRLQGAGCEVLKVSREIEDLADSRVPAALMRLRRALPRSLLVDIANLTLQFEQMRPDVVHAWLDWDNVRAGIAAVLAGVPKIILSGRNLAPYHFELHQSYMLPAYRALVKHPSVQLSNNSRAGANSYADWIRVKRSDVGVIYNGLSFSSNSRLSGSDRSQKRSEFGFGSEHVVVGGVFRFAEEKRPILWLETAALIAKKIPEARFLIYGQGSMEASMKAKIKELRLDKVTILAGVTSNPLEVMSMMEVFLLTSHGEGLPNVLIEAQSVGTAVVSTNAGGAPEAVCQGISGWIVNDDLPESISQSVIKLLENKELTETALAEGPRFVAEKFAVDRMVFETLKAYGVDVPDDSEPNEFGEE